MVPLKRTEAKLYVANNWWIDPDAKKNAGLKAVTLIATLNPVSQVLW
jgi:hypothetical protein